VARPLDPGRGGAREGESALEQQSGAHWAESAFRSGERYRAEGEIERALHEFARAAGSTGPFGCRARLEIAHIHRRIGRYREALDAYLELILGRSCADEDCGARDHALLWAGRACLEEGGADLRWTAQRLWTTCAATALDPILRIRAADWMACLLVEEGDLEGAAGVLNLCRAREGGAAQARTRHGERVQHALERMRAVGLLTQAVRARWLADPSKPIRRSR
jgi:hypothetical protein